ncbi:MAG: Nitrogen regulatory protein [Alphaproteobacteria bacterium MarineAlpha9_Bin7]|nr:MAG: Nitrogen regulatory protein [Alphaproteobacteria bacterium MarineAlpha9_Bin7]
MEIKEFLLPEAVKLNLKVTNKKQVLQELSRTAHVHSGANERDILNSLIERERLGTTGVGRGVAIPHGKVVSLDHLCAVFARLQSPINFDSVDDESVDLIFLLLAPFSQEHVHLKALAKISRLLRSDTMCAKLRGSTSADALYALLVETQTEGNTG